MVLAWTPDPNPNRVTLSDPDVSGLVGTSEEDVADAYNQWTLFHGANFELSARRPDRSIDRDLVDVVHTLADDPRLRRIVRADTVPPFTGRGIGLGDPGTPLATTTPGGASAPLLLSRVPLPPEALSRAYDNDRPDTYVAYDGIDPTRMVVVGIVDDGINIVHDRFRHTSGSRVDFAWAQDGAGDPLAALETLQFVGAFGTHRPAALRLRATHGTHVADLAAGYPPDDDAGLHRRIVAVQLPSLAVQDTSGTTLVSFVKTAAQFIFNRAFVMSVERKVDHPLPVVLPFSFGFGAGPRNGRFVLERVLRQQARIYRERVARHFAAKGRAVDPPAVRILPAGNGRLSRGHAVGCALPPSENQDAATHKLDMHLRVQPGDQTNSFVEIWLPDTTMATDITVTPPGGPPSEPLIGFVQASIGSGDRGDSIWPAASSGPNFDVRPQLLTRNGAVVARLTADSPNTLPARTDAEGPHRLIRVLLAIAPTDTVGLPAMREPAPAGAWRIEVSAVIEGAGDIRAWVQRDDTPGSARLTAKQAYIDRTEDDDGRVADPQRPHLDDDVGNTATVRRRGTLSGLATNAAEEGEPTMAGLDAVIATGIRADSGAPVPYAGLEDAKAEPPIGGSDITVVVERSRVLPGILAAGTMSGTTLMLNGTSMAPPQVARMIADWLEPLDEAQRGDFDAVAALPSILELEQAR